MPPRRKKLCDEEGEACPIKKSKHFTECKFANESGKDSESMKLTSGNDSSRLNTANKLRKRLTLKRSAEEAPQAKSDEQKAKGEVKSKYFCSEVKPLSPTKEELPFKSKGRKKVAQHEVNFGSDTSITKSSPQKQTTSKVARTKRSKSQKLTDNESVTEVAKAPTKRQINKEDNGEDISVQNKQKKRTCRSGANDQSRKQVTPKGRKNLQPSGNAPDAKSLQKVRKTGDQDDSEREEGDGEGPNGEKEKTEAESSSSDSESEWEDVEELPEVAESWKSQLPDKPIEIIVDKSDLLTARQKKRSFDVKEFFRLQLNRFRTQSQENAHKVHLLCLLSHGQFKNWICCDILLKSIALSLVPSEFTAKSNDKWTLKFLTHFTCWFKKAISLNEQDDEVTKDLKERLLSEFSERQATSEHEFILMFTTTCRSIGLLTRLVYSLQPITYKPTDLKKNKPTKSTSISAAKKTDKTDANKSQNLQDMPCSSSATVSKNLSTVNANTSKLHGSQSQKGKQETKNRLPRRCRSKTNYNEGGNKMDLDDSDDEWQEELDDSGSESSNSDADRKKRKPARRKQNSSDDDFDEPTVAFRKTSSVSKKLKVARGSRRKSNVSEISDDDRFEIAPKSFGSDWWTEVYLDEEKQWICISGCQLDINHPEKVEQQATKPLSYILAFDHESCIKDVTNKYASDWMSAVQKARVDESWWTTVLEPFQKQNCERGAKEDADVKEKLLKKPLPTSISDFKNHPLYALRRHLLKFEGIYPPNAPVLGHIHSEPVYPRECVHLLHAKEKWSLEGRRVREGEEPYKVVKARPKWNKPKEFNDQLKLPLFGMWQTDQFVPEPAIDGKVPKNEYGNVEIFKPWMIPAGAVYLKETLPGLGKVARKLEVDIAPAMVGWDFKKGFNIPIVRGWVVCEEHKDMLIAAWEEEQAIQEQKDAEKRQQRVLNNWRTLIRGLLIRERLKKRYNLEEPPSPTKRQGNDIDAEDSDDEDDSVPRNTLSWPENLKGKGNYKSTNAKHNLFPFEKEDQ